MTDTYQAVYDAVCSRLRNGDIGEAVKDAIREAGIAHYIEVASRVCAEEICRSAEAHRTPSAIYRPEMSLDGNQWCALYGANLQDGVAGFGDTPELAMAAFDKAWRGSEQ